MCGRPTGGEGVDGDDSLRRKRVLEDLSLLLFLISGEGRGGSQGTWIDFD